jgi:hypothetical protein
MKSMLKFLTLTLLAGVAITGCKKVETLERPPLQAHFLFKAGATYQVLTPTTSYKLPVGLTTVSDVDRTIELTVTSPTGAVAGTQYSLSKSTLVIPAGKAVDTVVVQGDFSVYSAGRKDTLVFTIKETADIKGIVTNSEFRLYVRGACLEEDINLNEFIGSYPNTNEDFGGSTYGPYTTTISAVKSLTATTGEVTVTNIYDFGWNPIKFILDWTDLSNRTVTLVQQSGIGNAGTLNSAYNGRDVSVRPHPTGGAGTYSFCNKTLRLVLQAGVTGLGFFNAVYIVEMAK